MLRKSQKVRAPREKVPDIPLDVSQSPESLFVSVENPQFTEEEAEPVKEKEEDLEECPHGVVISKQKQAEALSQSQHLVDVLNRYEELLVKEEQQAAFLETSYHLLGRSACVIGFAYLVMEMFVM